MPALRARLGLPAGADDRFDGELDAAVRAFQQSQGLTVDGLVGPNTLDLLNVTLVDGTGAAPRKGVTVTVRGGKIASIVERAPQPTSGVRQIDLGGRYLLPGVIDAHSHIESPAAALRALRSGVTTSRVLGDNKKGVLLHYTGAVSSILDLNSDAKVDFLWRYNPTGALAYWLMDGVTITAGGGITTLSTDWQLTGTPDLNADGKADLLWRHTPTGTIAYWIMSGASIVSTGTIGSVDMSWRIAGTPDLNADGKPDILWQHTPTGTIAVWYMSGTTQTSSAVIIGVGTDCRSWARRISMPTASPMSSGDKRQQDWWPTG